METSIETGYRADNKEWKQLSSSRRTGPPHLLAPTWLQRTLAMRECEVDLCDLLIFHRKILEIRIFAVAFQFISYTKTSAIWNMGPKIKGGPAFVCYFHLSLLLPSYPSLHPLVIIPCLFTPYQVTSMLWRLFDLTDALSLVRVGVQWEQKGKHNREKKLTLEVPGSLIWGSCGGTEISFRLHLGVRSWPLPFVTHYTLFQDHFSGSVELEFIYWAPIMDQVTAKDIHIHSHIYVSEPLFQASFCHAKFSNREQRQREVKWLDKSHS